MRKLKKGFTIVELVIVIAVIAVLTAVLVPVFISLSKKAKIANDQSLVANLNTALKMDEGEKGKKPSTMHDALLGLEDYGYKVPQLVTKSNVDLLYSIEKNEFCFSTDIAEGEEYKYWHIEKGGMPATQKYSIYAFEWTEAHEASGLTVGFDAGKESGITAVSYDRSSANSKRDVIIRTNSSATALTVKGYVDSSDSTKGDIVSHYGSAGELNIIKCAVGSYHENGKVAFAEIKTGRIVLEKDSEIKHIHINANANANGFEEVVIADNGTSALPNAITRDEVTVTEATTVVTVVSSSGTEVVKVYADGTQGTTEKTESQNTDVNSVLGQLALDNGYDSKVLDDQEKEAAKEESINDAMVDEYSSSDSKAIPENAVAYNVNSGAYFALGEDYTSGMAALRGALDAANSKDIILLLSDVVLNQASSSSRFNVSKSVTINGNNHTVTTNGRGFGVGVNATSKIDVTFKNITILNSNVEGRGIDTRGNLSSLTLDNVVIKTPNKTTQPLTIGGNQADIVPVMIKNSTLETTEDGSQGYGITTFNPVNMTIIHSTVKGWACLNIKGPASSAGSSGSTFNVSDTHFVSKNVQSSAASNSYCTVKMEDANVNVNFNLLACRFDITGVSNYEGIVAFQDLTFTSVTGCALTLGKGTVVNFEGLTYFAHSTDAGSVLVITGGSYNADPSEFVPDGYQVVEEDGIWTVSPSAEN